MKILIVDDEPLARTRLCRLIEGIPGMEITGSAASGIEAIAEANRLEPDIVLMDIRMPEMDGLEAARHLSRLEKPPAVIFTTAFDDHALAAFETHAVDYLVKPIRLERLSQSLEKAQRINRAQLQKLAEIQGNPQSRKYLNIGTQNRLELIPVDDILYFQADQKYVNVRHRKGTSLTEESLRSLEEEFGSKFIRIHRNALAAQQHIAGMEKDAQGKYFIKFRQHNDRLEVSRRHIAKLREILLQ